MSRELLFELLYMSVCDNLSSDFSDRFCGLYVIE